MNAIVEPVDAPVGKSSAKINPAPTQDIKSEKTTLFEKLVSGSVVIGGLIVTLLLIWILSLQLADINKDIESTAVECIKTKQNLVLDSSVSRYEACKIALEAEAQTLRTARAQTIVGARLFIQAIAMMAGISLMTMGSSFVFARIKGPSSTVKAEQKLATEGNWKFMVSSYFPGVVLAALGTIIVVATMHISTDQKSQTNDFPVFLDWPDRRSLANYPAFYAAGNLSKAEEKLAVSGMKKIDEEMKHLMENKK